MIGGRKKVKGSQGGGEKEEEEREDRYLPWGGQWRERSRLAGGRCVVLTAVFLCWAEERVCFPENARATMNLSCVAVLSVMATCTVGRRKN